MKWTKLVKETVRAQKLLKQVNKKNRTPYYKI